jgi:hypothetical protein
MPQKLTDKMAAIESLLGWICAHYGYVPGAEKTARQEWVSEPSPLDGPPAPPQFYNVECRGHCFTCIAEHKSRGKVPACPPEEKWLREYKRLRREYRIGEIEKLLKRLSGKNPSMAQAVWAVWVEPWPGALYNRSAVRWERRRSNLA